MPDPQTPARNYGDLLSAMMSGAVSSPGGSPPPDFAAFLDLLPSGSDIRRKLLELWAIPEPEVRRKQVEQYLRGTGLPETSERPTALRRDPNQNLPYVSERDYMPTTIRMPKDVAGRLLEELRLPYRLRNQPTVAMHGRGELGAGRLTNALGLGQATTSLGQDEQGPYLSVYDTWDFDRANNYPLDQLIGDLGQPFNVYDRIHFQLENGRVPQGIAGSGRGDIELPAEGDSNAARRPRR